MIVDLPDTQTQAITSKLRALREDRGEITTGRVLTLIVVSNGSDDIDALVHTLQEASREHPARVILLVNHRDTQSPRLDAQIRLGGDAGASEMILMHLHGQLAAHRASVVTPLLLPDTPIVAWWPGKAPRNPATDPIGELATRRITDACEERDAEALYRRRMTYQPGDSDLAWSRITLWRAVLASLVDQAPDEEILSVEISGPAEEPAVDIAAGWLADRLDVPVTRVNTDADCSPVDAEGNPVLGIERVVLHRASGPASVSIVDAATAKIEVGSMSSLVTLSVRPLADCLAEELRHLEPDETYGRALRRLVRVHRPGRKMQSSPVTYADEFEGSQR